MDGNIDAERDAMTINEGGVRCSPRTSAATPPRLVRPCFQSVVSQLLQRMLQRGAGGTDERYRTAIKQLVVYCPNFNIAFVLHVDLIENKGGGRVGTRTPGLLRVKHRRTAMLFIL